MDPRERPWCGIGVDAGLLAVSPRDVTVADFHEVKGIQQGVVHVPRNWRKPWYVETADGARHEIQGSPSEQAERSVSGIKQSLDSFRDASEPPAFPRIKYLIIFPDGYDFEGPKEFSILDREGVLTLTLRNLHNLPETILQATRDERLDCRKYRKWIEKGVLRKNDDSVIGTWLDPAFDKVEPESSRTPFWRLRQPANQETVAEDKEISSSDSSRTRLIQTQTRSKWSRSKVILSIITGIVIGTIGWRIYHAGKAATSVSRSRPRLTPPPPDKTKNTAQVIQAAMPQENPSLSENEKRDIVAAAKIRTPNEAREPELTGKNRSVESAKETRDRTQDAEDAKLNRQKIELQIRHAIRLRAITSVTVNFRGDKAYLKGKVDTESQRSAAEKAARSVPGVKEVRNSIEINQ